MDYKQILQAIGAISCILAWDVSIMQETFSCEENTEVKIKVRKWRGKKSPYISAVWIRQPVPLLDLCQLYFKRFTEEKKPQSLYRALPLPVPAILFLLSLPCQLTHAFPQEYLWITAYIFQIFQLNFLFCSQFSSSTLVHH